MSCRDETVMQQKVLIVILVDVTPLSPNIYTTLKARYFNDTKIKCVLRDITPYSKKTLARRTSANYSRSHLLRPLRAPVKNAQNSAFQAGKEHLHKQRKNISNWHRGTKFWFGSKSKSNSNWDAVKHNFAETKISEQAMLDPLVKAKNGFLRYACSANTLSIASISLAVLDAPLNSFKEKSILPLEMRSPSKSRGKRPKMKCMDKERRCVITYKSDS